MFPGLTILISFGVVTLLLVGLWLLSVRLRDASIIDPFWGAGFVVIAVTAAAYNQASAPRSWLLVALTTLWGLRLSIHLLQRNWGHGEDRRYVAMRQKHGRRFWWVSLFTVFLLQGVIMAIVALPLQIALTKDQPTLLGFLDLAGLLLWAVGLFFETVGDWQLQRFQANPANAGQVLDRGLWRYTRHPNYFGDFCVWWGLYLIAAAGGAWWTAFSPLLMSVLLLKVSGVTLLESTITTRRPEYASYQSRTSPFFPWPPKQV